MTRAQLVRLAEEFGYGFGRGLVLGLGEGRVRPHRPSSRKQRKPAALAKPAAEVRAKGAPVIAAMRVRRELPPEPYRPPLPPKPTGPFRKVVLPPSKVRITADAIRETIDGNRLFASEDAQRRAQLDAAIREDDRLQRHVQAGRTGLAARGMP